MLGTLLLASFPASAEEEYAGFLGATQVPVGTNWGIGSDDNLWISNGSRKNMIFPAVGFRYFTEGILGIEGSIMVWGQSGGTMRKESSTGHPIVMNSSFPHFWAFALRGGLPLRPFQGQQLSLIVIPELGFATGGGKESSQDGGKYDLSMKYVGTRLDVGVRAGGELRLGSFALQVIAGAYLIWESRGTTLSNQSGANFRTNNIWLSASVKGNLQDITNVAVLYYF